MYKRTVLKNGIRVVSCEMPQMRSVSFGVWFNVGGRFENKANKGVSHFLEHICFKGSRRFSGDRIKQIIEGVGGTLNAFTSEEFTCYLAKVLNKHLERSFGVIADMVLRPLIDPKEVEKERLVILEEIRMYRDHPQSYVYELLDELLWPGHPLGMNLAGTFQTVKAMKAKDIADFRGEFYSSRNIVIAAAGGVKHDKLAQMAEKWFGSLPESSPNQSPPVVPGRIKPENIFFKRTEQTHIALAVHSLRRGHPDRHALMLIHIILGANMSSRLFDELREKRGLAYEIGTQIKQFKDSGAFIVHAGVDNLRPAEAIEIILKELRKIKKHRVGLSEFRRAKDFYLGQLTMGLEQTMEEMIYVGEQTTSLDKIKTPSQIIRELSRVKIEDLRRVAGDIFRKENLSLALIGPIQGGDKAGIKERMVL